MIARRRVGRGGGGEDTMTDDSNDDDEDHNNNTTIKQCTEEREGLTITAAIGSWWLATLTTIDGDGDRP